jgi:membrane protein DedA with SNARE-associated domain
MASAVWMLYPNSKAMQCIVVLYALYIGMGVSMTIHWFSDFVAGAIIGAVISVTAGKVFKEHLFRTKK